MRARRPRWQPWHSIAAFFAFGWIILFIGRAVLSPLLGPIGREWGLDEAQLGLVSSVFYAAYTIMQIPTGLLADRLGRKRLIIASFLLAGLALVARGLAPTYVLFVLAGAFTGLAQGLYFAPHFAIISATVPPARHAVGSAFVYTGTSIGSALGLVFGSLMTFRLGLGWRASFLLLAIPSVLAAPVAARVLRGVEETGRKVGRLADGPPTGRLSVRAAFTWRLSAIYAINFASLYAFFTLLSWLPYYLQYERGFSGTAAGVVSSLVPWASLAGGIIFGLVSDRSGSRLGPLRYLLPAAGLAVGAVGYLRSPALLCVLLIFYGVVGKSALDPLLVSSVFELTPAGRTATALGFLNFFGMAASVAAPYAAGLLAKATGSLAPAFVVSGAVLLAASAVAVFAARPPRAAG